jgi:hypothetical protein
VSASLLQDSQSVYLTGVLLLLVSHAKVTGARVIGQGSSIPGFSTSVILLPRFHLYHFVCTRLETRKAKMQCGISADTHFGPRVLPCRRDFDFTLLFEQAILALAPDLLFLVLCFFRWFHIRREPKEVHRGATGTWKKVGLPSAFLVPK